MRQLLFRDSDSRVAYIKLHTLFLLFISHMDAARGGKLRGIVHEIGDDLDATGSGHLSQCNPKDADRILIQLPGNLYLRAANDIFTKHIHIRLPVGELKRTGLNLR